MSGSLSWCATGHGGDITEGIMSWLRQDGQQVDNAVFLLDLAYALVYSVPI